MTEHDSIEIPARRPPRPVRALRLLWRLARDPAYRQMMRLYWFPRRDGFQPFNDTRADRYPVIFKFVQEQLGAEQPLDVLSFGCATGEEAFSLRGYFPRAAIKGIDINPGNIAAAQRRLRKEQDPAISFACESSAAGEPAHSYDAIFCMAVLRHGSLGHPGVTRCDHLLRFDDFAAAIADFHRCLRPGGLLVLRHSNFRLCDTPSAEKFEMILSVPLRGPKRTPIFGPDNRLMAGIDYPDTVFRAR
jgi:SAM-dependent methyltransferase